MQRSDLCEAGSMLVLLFLTPGSCTGWTAWCVEDHLVRQELVFVTHHLCCGW